MLDLKNLGIALDQLAQEKGISKDKIIETIEMALAAAYKKDYGEKTQIIRGHFDPASGKASFSQIKIVVDESMIKSEEELAQEEVERQARIEMMAQGKMPTEPVADETEEDGVIKKVRFNPERHIMIKD